MEWHTASPKWRESAYVLARRHRAPHSDRHRDVLKEVSRLRTSDGDAIFVSGPSSNIEGGSNQNRFPTGRERGEGWLPEQVCGFGPARHRSFGKDDNSCFGVQCPLLD